MICHCEGKRDLLSWPQIRRKGLQQLHNEIHVCMPFVMMTFQNPPAKSKILAPGSQRLRSKLDLHSKNGTDRFFTDIMSPRHWDKQSFKGICLQQQQCVEDSRAQLACCSMGAGIWEPSQESEQCNFYRSYLIILWLSGVVFIPIFFQSFHYNLFRLDTDKITPFERHLKTEKYDKEVRKNCLVFSEDKLRKPYPFSWRSHWAWWTR